ncbi:MAG: tol-pal system-associated acyl-CoA thioesterase [Spongiibacteraceae bacterium]|nr:tol-pal system-associated acyl-CoA thioesterase [Spongiibacteraceae bacterium]
MPDPVCELAVRVYIEDTDAGGIVYYPNYLRFMERGRTEFMRELGFGRAAIFDNELMFVVQSVELEYKAPARLDDLLTVTSRIAESGAAQLLFDQRILRDGVALCEGFVRIVCVDRQTLKPRRIPKSLMAALQRAC